MTDKVISQLNLDERASVSDTSIREHPKERVHFGSLSDSNNSTEDSPLSTPNEAEINKIRQAVQRVEQRLEAEMSQLFKVFEQKIAFDASKQQQIDRLHTELQQYRTDLIAKTNRPLVNGLIQLYGEIGQLITRLKSKPNDQLEPALFLKTITGIQEDIEILLDQNGITAFTEEQVDTLQPRRQRAIKNLPTTDDKQVGTVAERLMPGFEQGNEIIQKERVIVYVLDKQKC